MTEKTTEPTQFDALLGELGDMEALTKALNEPEPAPAPEGEDEDEEEDTSTIRENGDEARQNAAPGPTLLGKSLTVQIDGEDTEVLDADALVQVLTKTVEGQEAHTGQIEILGKGLRAALGTIKVMATRMQEQEQLIKSFGDKPRGRLSALQLPGGGAAPKPAGPANAEEVMAKCMGWLGDGTMTAAEVSTAESALNARQPLPAALVKRLTAA